MSSQSPRVVDATGQRPGSGRAAAGLRPGCGRAATGVLSKEAARTITARAAPALGPGRRLRSAAPGRG